MSLYIGGSQAIGAHGASLKAERTSQTAIEKLATGKQLERAGENAVGVGSSQRMAADMVGLNRASSNIASAGDMLSVVVASLYSVSDLLLRARELSVQFGNSTLDGTQKRMIEDELRFTVAENNVSQFVALETLDMSGFDGLRKAEQLIINSLSQIHAERS